jgi:hypothetical protein
LEIWSWLQATDDSRRAQNSFCGVLLGGVAIYMMFLFKVAKWGYIRLLGACLCGVQKLGRFPYYFALKMRLKVKGGSLYRFYG